MPKTVIGTGDTAMNKVPASVELKFWQGSLSCQQMLFSWKP